MMNVLLNTKYDSISSFLNFGSCHLIVSSEYIVCCVGWYIFAGVVANLCPLGSYGVVGIDVQTIFT